MPMFERTRDLLRFSRFLPLMLILLFLTATKKPGGESPLIWPEISPIEKSYFFSNIPSALPSVDFEILSLDGKPLYQFMCRSGDHDFPDDLFVGTLDCHLHSLHSTEEYYHSLLASDVLDDRPTLTRAWLSAGDLYGGCANYPEHGATRTFRLRGMKITMSFKDYKFLQISPHPRLRSFRFEVQVLPDKSALTAIAEDVPYLRPRLLPNGRSECGEVQYQRVPGRVSKEYLTQEGLEPPFAAVVPAVRSGVLTRQVGFEMPIHDPEGRLGYNFSCTNHGRWGIQCGLFFPQGKLNLLTDGVDPYSKLSPSVVLPAQLYGSCAMDLEWGASRQFYLRRMRLNMELTDARFSSEPPETGYDFIDRVEIRVWVSPDEGATSPVATKPRTPFLGLLRMSKGC